MKYTLALVGCFVFASLVNGQDYGRSRTPKKPVVHPKPIIHPKPFDAGPLIGGNPINGIGGGPIVHPKPLDAGPFMGGGGVVDGALPPHIANVIGGTITGGHIGRETAGFPVHGGSGLTPDGLRNGVGADPNEAAMVAAFNNQMNGPGLITGGQFQRQLIFDPAQGKYVRKHQQAKASQHAAVKSGGPVFGGHSEDDDDVHIIRKTVAGVGPGAGHFVDPVGPHVSSKIVEQQIHNNAKAQSHNVIKSGVISAGKPIHRNQGPGNFGPMGNPIPGIINHDIQKASFGANSAAGHMMAKSSGAPSSIGFINPQGVVANKMRHNTFKSTGGKMMGGAPVVDQFVPLSDLGVVHNVKKASGMGISPVAHQAEKIQHNVIKSSGGIIPVGGSIVHPKKPNSAHLLHNVGKSGIATGGHGVNPIAHQAGKMQHVAIKSNGGVIPVGGQVNPIAHQAGKMQHVAIKSNGGVIPVGGPVIHPKNTNPVQTVHNVGKSGIASHGHDPLAANIGLDIAKKAISKSAHAVDIGSNGGVSAGNPVAIAAAGQLAGEAAHIAGKTLNIASQGNPIKPHGPIGVGNNIFGGVHPKPIHPKPIHPKPVHPKPVKAKPIVPKPVQPKFPTGYGRRRY